MLWADCEPSIRSRKCAKGGRRCFTINALRYFHFALHSSAKRTLCVIRCLLNPYGKHFIRFISVQRWRINKIECCIANRGYVIIQWQSVCFGATKSITPSFDGFKYWMANFYFQPNTLEYMFCLKFVNPCPIIELVAQYFWM